MRVQVTENSDDTVTIRGRKMAGWIDRDRGCPRCDTPVVYSPGFLARFCAGCNRWLERHCEDPECLHCTFRPERPLAA
jgi:hypothetical protein